MAPVQIWTVSFLPARSDENSLLGVLVSLAKFDQRSQEF